MIDRGVYLKAVVICVYFFFQNEVFFCDELR